jgi:hypothetical protein
MCQKSCNSNSSLRLRWEQLGWKPRATHCRHRHCTLYRLYTVQYCNALCSIVPDFFTVISMGREPLEHLTARHMYVCGAMALSLGPRNRPLYTNSLEGADFTPWPWPVWIPGGSARSSTSTEGKKRLPC